MIYELRTYTVVPGQMPALLRRFETRTIPIWQRHGIEQIGFFTTVIGPESGRLTYVLAYRSLADRETRWAAFQNDAEWLAVRAESERDGPLVENIGSEILAPTSFSALK